MTAAARLIRDYWAAMNGNDWAAVAGRFLAPDFRLLWPQTGEVLNGRDVFARINGAFPGQGGWRFEIVSLLAEGDRVVTDTRIRLEGEAVTTARAITFHDIAGGFIRQQTEFWPDPYEVPEWRRGMTLIDPQQASF